MPRVIHFEIDAEKPERALKFYADVFGWKAEKWQGPIEYWLLTTGNEDEPGINGGLSRRTEAQPATVNTVDVPSIDDYATKVECSGGSIVRPKQAIPGVGWIAYFKDPEGNLLGMREEDATAR